MSLKKECLVVIPALNPKQNILPYVRDIIQEGFTDVVVINDGSKAECSSIFEELATYRDVTVLMHEINRGKGAALKTAFEYFLSQKNNHQWAGVITADADGQHLVRDLVKVFEELKDTTGWLILGTRDFDQGHVPKKSKFGNKMTTSIFRLFYGKKINDTQTGLRGISYDLIEEFITIEGDRFEYEINMLIKAVKDGVLIREIGIETVYLNDNETSHFRPFIDSFLIYRHLLNHFLIFIGVAISSFVIDFSIFQLLIIIFGVLSSGLRISVASVIARICSSMFNYFMNKKFVFNNKKKVSASIFKYYILMLVELAISTTLVMIVYRLTFLSELLSKILVDSIIFFFSFFIQRYIVFRND